MSANLGTLDWALIVTYLVAMIGLGAALSRRIKGFKDYFLAGGALTTPLLICTLVSTYFGLDVTFGTSESAFYDGVSAWVWYSFPYYITLIFAALVIAPRLRRLGGMMTLSDLLDRQYGPGTRFISAIACFVYSAPILQMAGMITLLSLLGLPTHSGLIIAIVVCAVYTIMGGLWADAVSDTVQFLLMCVSIAVMIPLALERVEGFAFAQQLPAEHLTGGGDNSTWLLLAWAAGSLTVLVEPAFYNRAFAAKDARSIRNALLLGIGLWAAYDWGVVIIGMMAQAAVTMGLEGFGGDLEGREALLTMGMNVLPTGLRGLMLGGILASAMSTIDSYSLLASGNLTYDILRPLRRAAGREFTDRALLRLTRVGVFAVMAAAAVISLAFDRIREGWLFMTSVLVSVVLVPALGALFGRPQRAAGLTASAAGLLGLIVFYAVMFTQGVRDPDEETYVLRIGSVEIWQECAVLFAAPVSLLGFLAGEFLGRWRAAP